MKHSRILIAVALPILALLTLASCNDDNGDKIPFDRKKAREHIISYGLADTMRADFIAGRDSLVALLAKDTTNFANRFNLPTAEMFNRDAIIALLDADGAAGVRIYLGRDMADSGKVKLVLLPVDKNGKDIMTNLLNGKRPVTQKAAAQADEEEEEDGGFQAIEVGQRCPTICD